MILKQRIAKALFWYANREYRLISLGELSRVCDISKSTLRRHLIKMGELGLVHTEYQEYKSTGRRMYELSNAGLNWFHSQKGILF